MAKHWMKIATAMALVALMSIIAPATGLAMGPPELDDAPEVSAAPPELEGYSPYDSASSPDIIDEPDFDTRYRRTSDPIHAQYTGPQMIADALVIRPLLFVASVTGTAFFVVTLPATAIDQSIGHSADVLITRPFKWTFGLPLGYF